MPQSTNVSENSLSSGSDEGNEPSASLKLEPFGLIVDTSTLCNNSCFFCWRSNDPLYLKSILKRHAGKPFMEFNVFKRIIDQACLYQHFTHLRLEGPMGDPLLNPLIVDFAQYAYSTGHFDFINLNTNGHALEQHNVPLLLSSISRISISVDSIDQETYRKIHGCGSLSHVLSNLKQLVDFKKTVGCLADIVVRFTENVLNIGQFPAFREYMIQLGVDSVNYTKMHSFMGVHAGLISSTTAQACNQPKLFVNFNFMGELTTCCLNWKLFPCFGNIMDNSLKILWDSEHHMAWVYTSAHKKSPCMHCNGLGPQTQKSGLMFDARGLQESSGGECSNQQNLTSK